MITRNLEQPIINDLQKKMVFVSGPRQVGKTTMAFALAEKRYKGAYKYFNWDSIEDRRLLMAGSLPGDSKLIIFDEIHKYRKWKNYLKGQYDKYKSRFHILVTGSARMDNSVVSRKYIDICRANFVPDSRRDECSVPPVAHKRGATQKPGESGSAQREGSYLANFRRTLPKHTAEGMPASAFAKTWLKSEPSNINIFAGHDTGKGGDSMLGRYFHYVLHPLTLAEVTHSKTSTEPFKELLFHQNRKEQVEALVLLNRFGGFPEMFVAQNPRDLRRWHNDRVDRLIREDIRDVENLRDLSSLQLLVDMIPSKAGGLLSLNSLREDMQVSHKTVSLWMDVLERFYYHFRVYPYQNSLIKSLRKEPKLYLWDWTQLENEGARFENLVASHLLKMCDYLRDVEGYKAKLFYIRDVEQRETDFLVAIDNKPWFCVEVKLSATNVSSSLRYFMQKIKAPFGYQVVMTDGVDLINDQVRIISASKFLASIS